MCPFGDDRDIMTVVVLGGKSVEEFFERHHGYTEGNAGDGYAESLCVVFVRGSMVRMEGGQQKIPQVPACRGEMVMRKGEIKGITGDFGIYPRVHRFSQSFLSEGITKMTSWARGGHKGFGQSDRSGR